MTDTADPDVRNVAETVSVAWRSRPDGRARLTYVEREDGADSVFEYRPEIDASERVVSFETRVGGRFGDVDWSPDGRSLAYSRDGQIRLFDTDDRRERTPAPSDAFDGAPRFGPDGDQVAFLSGRDGDHVDVYRLSLSDGRVERVTVGANPADDRRWAPAWSPGGSRIAYVGAAEWEDRQWADAVHVVDVASGETEQLTEGLTVSSVPSWGPEGERLAFFATGADEPWYRHSEDVHVYDLASDDRTRYSLEASHQYFQQRPLWDEAGRRLFYPVRQRGRQHLESVVVDPDAEASGVATRVTTHDGVFGAGPVVRAADGRFGYPYAAFDAPPTPRIHRPETGTAADVRVPDTPDGVLVPENVTVETRDGLFCNAYLYRPPAADEGSSVPGLVQLHGGGHFQYGEGWHPTEQYLAANGYAVLALDFRGSGGYGRDFQALSMGDWHGGQVRDTVDAAQFLRDQSFTTDAVGVYGRSWGGMLTMHAITQFPTVFDAAVEWYGIVDQAGGYEGADRLGRLLRERDLDGTPTERPERYRLASTDWRLDAVETPLSVLHGAEDARVPVDHAELLDAELGDRPDLSFELTIYEDEGHGFRDAETRRDSVRRTRAWFDRHLRD